MRPSRAALAGGVAVIAAVVAFFWAFRSTEVPAEGRLFATDKRLNLKQMRQAERSCVGRCVDM
jgi:hypothetical protein